MASYYNDPFGKYFDFVTKSPIEYRDWLKVLEAEKILYAAYVEPSGDSSGIMYKVSFNISADRLPFPFKDIVKEEFCCEIPL